jgi:hypothetical protein
VRVEYLFSYTKLRQTNEFTNLGKCKLCKIWSLVYHLDHTVTNIPDPLSLGCDVILECSLRYVVIFYYKSIKMDRSAENVNLPNSLSSRTAYKFRGNHSPNRENSIPEEGDSDCTACTGVNQV